MVVEMLHAGPSDRRRQPPWWVWLCAAVALASLAVLAVTQRTADPPTTTPTALHRPNAAPPRNGSAASPVPTPWTCPAAPGQPTAGSPASLPQDPVAALVLDGAAAGSGLDRRDRSAASGPWSVVVRRRDGSLGRHSAVVTFPTARAALGDPVAVGGASGRVTSREVNWPIHGGQARVRGDLGAEVLVKLAAATRIVNGRPTLVAPAGYTVVSRGPYRSPHLREVRYSGSGLPPTLGGLVYTGVTSLAGFEDQLYGSSSHACGVVHGQAAILTAVGGGNGTLAWQVSTDQVSYVGYSGSGLTGTVLRDVYRLAVRSRAITERQWRASRPQVIDL